MGPFVKVGRVQDFRIGRGRQVDVEGAKIAVFLTRDGWIALDDTCPHMGASLADGRLSGHELQCSWHEWRFDTATGRCPLRPWACVRVHEVRIDGDDVLLARPQTPARPESGTEDEPEWLDWDPSRFFKKKDP